MGTEVSGDPRYANRLAGPRPVRRRAPEPAPPAPSTLPFASSARRRSPQASRRIVRTPRRDRRRDARKRRQRRRRRRDPLRPQRPEEDPLDPAPGPSRARREDVQGRKQALPGKPAGRSRAAATPPSRWRRWRGWSAHFGREFPSAAAAAWRSQLEASATQATAAGSDAEATRRSHRRDRGSPEPRSTPGRSRATSGACSAPGCARPTGAGAS